MTLQGTILSHWYLLASHGIFIGVKKQIFLAMRDCTFTKEKVFISVPIESPVFQWSHMRDFLCFSNLSFKCYSNLSFKHFSGMSFKGFSKHKHLCKYQSETPRYSS